MGGKGRGCMIDYLRCIEKSYFGMLAQDGRLCPYQLLFGMHCH